MSESMIIMFISMSMVKYSRGFGLGSVWLLRSMFGGRFVVWSVWVWVRFGLVAGGRFGFGVVWFGLVGLVGSFGCCWSWRWGSLFALRCVVVVVWGFWLVVFGVGGGGVVAPIVVGRFRGGVLFPA